MRCSSWLLLQRSEAPAWAPELRSNLRLRALRSDGVSIADGGIPSPNIWQHPQTYEIENRAVDPDGVIEPAMRAIRDWARATVLDLGCGTGFHLPMFAATAARVIGVEPHGALAEAARRRTRALTNVEVRAGFSSALSLTE